MRALLVAGIVAQICKEPAEDTNPAEKLGDERKSKFLAPSGLGAQKKKHRV